LPRSVSRSGRESERPCCLAELVFSWSLVRSGQRQMMMLRKCLLATMGVAFSASAGVSCQNYEEMNLRDIFHADMIVLGDVWAYEIVGPSSTNGYPADYARLNVRVQKVFFPNGPESAAPPTRSDPNRAGSVRTGMITVTWVNSTYGLPDDLESEDHSGFLIALRFPTADRLPTLPSNEFIDDAPEPEHYTVLQRHCSSPFIFDGRGPISIALQQVLETDRDREVEFQILEEFLFERQAMSKLEREIYMLKSAAQLSLTPAETTNE
jgi:hypothetical protein